MKPRTRPTSPLLVATACALLASCATMDDNDGMYAASPATYAADDKDRAYIANVETLAKRRGVEVVWINPPTRDEQD